VIIVIMATLTVLLIVTLVGGLAAQSICELG
jgi:hypothetical protein